jgi:hypothetical protein
MNTTTTTAAAALLAVALSTLAQAGTSTWTGADTDHNTFWSPTANWDTAAAPGAGDTAILGDAATARTLIYDAGASGALGTLTFGQTSAATSTLEIRRSLNLSDALTLSGATRLFINTTGTDDAANGFAVINSGTVLTANAGITIENGGALELGRQANTNRNWLTYLSGPVTIGNGGTLKVQNAAKTDAGPASFEFQIAALTLNIGGHLILGAASTNTETGYTDITDTRLDVNGDFIALGGILESNTANNDNRLALRGATNILSSALTLAGTYKNSSGNDDLRIVLDGGANQSLQTDKSISFLTLRASGVKTLSGEGLIGTLQFRATGPVTLKSGGDLTINTLQQWGSTAGTRFTIDTNDADDNARTLTIGNLILSTVAWTFQGDGTLQTPVINLAAATTTTIADTITLIATRANSANNLGDNSDGAISAGSTFAYAAGAGTASSTLQSNRSIGHLRVDSGTLKLAGTADITATTVTVKAGGILDISDRAFTTTTQSLTLGITGDTSGQILTGATNAFTATGTTLTLDFGDAPALADAHYNLFGGATLTGSFTSVVLAGQYYSGITLTNTGAAWTATSSDGHLFTLNAANGDLYVSTYPVPEPAAFAMFAGLGALAALATGTLRRRRHHARS